MSTTTTRRYTKQSLTVTTIAILMGCKPDSGLINVMNDLRENGRIGDGMKMGAIHRAVLVEMLRIATQNCD